MNLWKKILYASIIVLAFLLIIEFSVRIFIRKSSLIDNLIPSISNDGYYYLISDKLTRASKRKPPQINPSPKQPREYRIVTFGGSSTFGSPGSPELSFPHFLKIILTKRWPQIDFKVYNLGIFAQTYTFALQAMKDSLSLEPDLLVVYSGHNELYPHNLYWTVRYWTGKSTIFKSAYNWLSKNSILFSALLDLREKSVEKNQFSLDPTILRDFDWKKHVNTAIKNYKWVTTQMIEVATRSDINIMFITPLRNLSDFPPLPGDDTLPLLSDSEERIINQHQDKTASDYFRLGKYYIEKKLIEKAKACFEKASDMTIRAGRIHSEMISFLKHIKSAYTKLSIIDMEKSILYDNHRKFIGDWCLVDWCHPTTETNYYIAKEITNKMLLSMESHFGKPKNEIPLFEDVISCISTKEQVKALINIRDEESGYMNLIFERWDLAYLYFSKRIQNEYSLKSALGLMFTNLQLAHFQEAKENALLVREKSSNSEIIQHLKQYYQRNTSKIVIIQIYWINELIILPRLSRSL